MIPIGRPSLPCTGYMFTTNQSNTPCAVIHTSSSPTSGNPLSSTRSSLRRYLIGNVPGKKVAVGLAHHVGARGKAEPFPDPGTHVEPASVGVFDETLDLRQILKEPGQNKGMLQAVEEVLDQRGTGEAGHTLAKPETRRAQGENARGQG